MSKSCASNGRPCETCILVNMIVQSNSLGWRLFISPCRLSARKLEPFCACPRLRRQGYAVISSKSRKATILQDVSEGPASTCWSLLSSSSSAIVGLIESLARCPHDSV